MTSLQEFFNKHNDDVRKGVLRKNNQIKRNIIAYLSINEQCTLAELAKELHVSVPTITKLVSELVSEALVTDNGKVETPGGRRPNIFGLATSTIYFAGVDICRDCIRFVITDLTNNQITYSFKLDFELKDSSASLENICSNIDDFLSKSGVDRTKILGMGVCIPGRVNPKTGRCYKYFNSNIRSLREIIEECTGMKVVIENDTRARCYAEYFGEDVVKEKNVIYLNIARGGVATGIITDGKLYYGKSGFAGEFGHSPFFDNEIICACGKKGCLETEVSGNAIENRLMALVNGGVNTILKSKIDAGSRVHISDIIEAAKDGDNLCIELIEEAGEKLGRGIAYLINLFNPELVIMGGELSTAGDLITMPIKSAASKYSLGLVYNDTRFHLSSMDERTGAVGAAMIIRNDILGL